jgi:hypothetical protein
MVAKVKVPKCVSGWMFNIVSLNQELEYISINNQVVNVLDYKGHMALS